MASILNSKVLVLNRSWIPVKVISLRKAITLLFSVYKSGQPKAFVVDAIDFNVMSWEDWSKKPLSNEIIHSPNESFSAPKVIILSRYNKLPIHPVCFNIKSLIKRDENTCQYCDKELKSGERSVDHVIPKSQGGSTSWDNCVISCKKCNGFKANRTPEQAGLKLKKKPERPKSHFFLTDLPSDIKDMFLSKK